MGRMLHYICMYFLSIFLMFFIKKCVLLSFSFLFLEEVSNIRNKILTDQKPEYVIRNYQRNCIFMLIRIFINRKCCLDKIEFDHKLYFEYLFYLHRIPCMFLHAGNKLVMAQLLGGMGRTIWGCRKVSVILHSAPCDNWYLTH